MIRRGELGSGTTAVVHVWVLREGGGRCAGKVFRPEHSACRKHEHGMALRFEGVDNILQLSPGNIQRLLIKSAPTPAIAFELCHGSWKDKHIQAAFKWGWVVQLARALEHVHGRNLVHCDVKPENVLLKNGVVKLADFGLMCEPPVDSDYCQSMPFAAPECSLPSQLVGTSTDVWAFAVTVIETKSGCGLFPNLPRGDDLYAAVTKPLRNIGEFLQPLNLGSRLNALAAHVLVPQCERPTMAQLETYLGVLLYEQPTIV